MLLLIHYLLLLPLFVFLVWSLFCYAVLSVLSSFAIISLRKRNWLLYFNCVLAVMWQLEFHRSSGPLGWSVVYYGNIFWGCGFEPHHGRCVVSFSKTF